MEMNQYLDMFIEESKEHIQAINDHLLVLENDPENVNLINEIFRSAHTLKGMAATMGFEDMAALTHEMENVLDQARNHKLVIDTDIMDVIFKCVDVLETMLYSIAGGGDGKEDVSHIVAALKAILKGELPVSIRQEDVSQPESASGKETAATAIAETAEDMRPYQLDEYEFTVIEQSIESGYHAYWIKTSVKDDCVLKAARAYMVYDNLESLGEIIKTTPSVEELEEEKFEKSFEIVLISKETEDKIEKTVMNVSEIEAVEVREIQPNAQHTASVQQQEEKQPAASVAPTKQPAAKGTKEEKTAAKAPVAKKSTTSKTIRVDIERLDVLMNLFSELVIDRGRLEQLARESGQSALMETVEHMSRISGDLQNIILTMRMVPVEQVFNRFPRMVRDLAKDLNKKINLEIVGADTELDRTVIDEIGDPLVHLLRNSLDHGVESAEERRAAGKPEEGLVQLKAYHSGNHVFIEVRDDGKGINREKVLKKALERGILTEQTASSLSDKQIYELLFASGLSTADQISDVSGRGVGLDVVKTKIESLGGSCSVDSNPGAGTTFLIQLPLTLSIISAMLVQVEDEKFAVPLSSIIETAVFSPDDIMHAHQQDVIDFRGRIVPLVSLKSIFNIPDSIEHKDNDISVVIVRKGDKMAGLVVDSFIGQQEIVLKSLGKYLTNVFAISGATILGDGQVALIIDCNALIK
ncbi:chemotaxis protein CheA [Aneurinibacillus aneurinilyticus]|jgi:two-component system chemotaxis sensor kinase CheA|uniref:Chemotaxis protein CheA n=2 Tax=Aneurinibacillus aneurinilyticus TaxID=1391 RepID=A0A848CQH3_ANEAE|nr:chemotaxis protein CheA [Aneurinibacillus aneurinilyticus]ERI09231.1 chemotaxis protein CheA [Aneurinibacillus aneurinilyticus ATCC 12856]MCI1692415.1 chemotaxis protein CheA [Aneurinibacillus aneurinilyticus]MED0669340.1 chemotaxis protein CheA [Aneurinibacillus aneurinilyticus]MED0707413.1 chemotaxis protein CheA [Aneurinibacillus aneurinilyticus]MED0724779.1 chemotaxis protein CheA [Aneurinibacillus aneurinilyticus]